MRPTALIVMNQEAADDVYGDELTDAIALQTNLLHPSLVAPELAERPDLLAQAEVIFSGWGAPLMDEAFLAKAVRLRAVFFAGDPAPSWLTDALWRRRIHVSTAANANADSVAEYTAAMIMIMLKRSGRFPLRSNPFETSFPDAGRDAATRIKVGFMPLQLVARLTMQRLKHFEIDFLACEPGISPERARQLGATRASLKEVFEQCDAISAHVPLPLATGGAVGRAHFAAMKHGAVFINTGQAVISPQSELAEILEQRPDITVTLDVPCSPLPTADLRLAALPNVTLTPQIADALGPESRQLGQAMFDEFERWRTGSPLKDAELFDSIAASQSQ